MTSYNGISIHYTQGGDCISATPLDDYRGSCERLEIAIDAALQNVFPDASVECSVDPDTDARSRALVTREGDPGQTGCEEIAEQVISISNQVWMTCCEDGSIC